MKRLAAYNSTMDLPAAARPLFDLPPEEFTAGRDRISKQLKSSGDSDGAAAVKALKRPSVTAHALNLVARRHPDLIGELLKAGDDLGSARSRAAMESAKSERQKAIGSIITRAAALLAEQGRPVTAQLKEKLTETLLAAATDQDTRQRLENGSLLKEAVPGGLGAPVTAFAPQPGEGSRSKAGERSRKLREQAEAKLEDANNARADSQRASRESAQLAEVAAAARERAEKLANIARRSEEIGRAKLAEAEELEKAGG